MNIEAYSPHMLLDPKTTPSRLFVKNLPTNGLSKLELHEHFSQYGKVLGINYQQDFAFIQMDSPAQADQAVRSEHGRSFMGNQLKVFKARIPDERKIPESLKNSYDQRVEAHQERRPPPSRSGVTGVHEPMNAVSENNRSNDCEIVVHDRSQRAYAEMIERNLKKIGLVVDLFFPNETIPIHTLLSNIASRGTLYAISVSPQHELKASLTLNILHGEDGGEEHRNMPVDKAVSLIGRDFERYVAAGGLRQGVGTADTDGSNGIMPANIENLLTMLAQSKPLTVMQYEALINFLASRRIIQMQLEIGATETPKITSSVTTSEAAQLQQRIISIMDQKLSKPAPAPAPLLQDPKVQLALSSLFPAFPSM